MPNDTSGSKAPAPGSEPGPVNPHLGESQYPCPSCTYIVLKRDAVCTKCGWVPGRPTPPRPAEERGNPAANAYPGFPCAVHKGMHHFDGSCCCSTNTPAVRPTPPAPSLAERIATELYLNTGWLPHNQVQVQHYGKLVARRAVEECRKQIIGDCNIDWVSFTDAEQMIGRLRALGEEGE